MVVYEAMAAGLPVICTHNTGSVIRDGVDGYIVPIRNSYILAEKLRILNRDRELLAHFSSNAAQRIKEFTMDKYSERLTAIIADMTKGRWSALNGPNLLRRM